MVFKTDGRETAEIITIIIIRLESSRLKSQTSKSNSTKMSKSLRRSTNLVDQKKQLGMKFVGRRTSTQKANLGFCLPSTNNMMTAVDKTK